MILLDHKRWIAELFFKCTEKILTTKERDIYFAYMLDKVNAQIKERLDKLCEYEDDYINFIYTTEKLHDLACEKAVLAGCVEQPELKDYFSTIPLKKLKVMEYEVEMNNIFGPSFRHGDTRELFLFDEEEFDYNPVYGWIRRNNQ